MIRQTLQNVCESRYRWLIVTGGTFVVGLVLIVPIVDVYCAEKSEREALQADLEAVGQLAATLGEFESRVDAQVARLQAVEARTVDEQTLPALRDRLVEVARETGCSLRRLNVGDVVSRAWYEDDNPIAQKTNVKRQEEKTSFDLQSRPISVSVTGTIDSLRHLLEQLKADEMFVHTKTFEIYPSPLGRKTLTLDMELWYFALARGGP